MEMKIGQLIDRLFELRKKKLEISNTLKPLQKEIDDLNGKLMEKMDYEKTIKACGTKASVTLREETFANVEDWDEVYRFINKNNAEYILERRMSASAYRELLNMGTAIPGTKTFTKRSVSLRKI